VGLLLVSKIFKNEFVERLLEDYENSGNLQAGKKKRRFSKPGYPSAEASRSVEGYLWVKNAPLVFAGEGSFQLKRHWRKGLMGNHFCCKVVIVLKVLLEFHA